MRKSMMFWIGIIIFATGAILMIASLGLIPGYIFYRIRDGTFNLFVILQSIGLWFVGDLLASMVTTFGWIIAHSTNKIQYIVNDK